jgi:isoleucyl-tRNA synthetase
MSRLQGLIGKVTEAYEGFDFHEAFHAFYNFCVVDLSSFYLDILKDRLYTFRADSPERRAAQWVLRRILTDMTRLLAPILSFTAEEVWGYLLDRNEESVFLAGFPAVEREFINEALEARWSSLIAVRDEVNKALEIKRKEKMIGNALEAKVVIHTSEEHTDLLRRYLEYLPTLFIVSEVDLQPFGVQDSDVYQSDSIAQLFIRIERASGRKCERCWNWSTSVGAFSDHPAVCERCYRVIR